MGFLASQYDHARHRHGQSRRNDPRKASPCLCRRASRRHAARLIVCLFAVFIAQIADADPLRIATFNTELSRKGPGLLLRDILKDQDPQITAVGDLLTVRRPDIVVLQGFDHDLGNAALAAFADYLDQRGLSYPHAFALRPNTGLQTGHDLDGDGELGGPRDAQGYGRFSGQGGMAILSRFPIATDNVRDFSTLLWRDLPGAVLPTYVDGTPFPSPTAQAVQRLSSTGHWVVPVDTPGGRLWLLTFHATPPVFDGPEDRNGLRNNDEIAFWSLFLDGTFGPAPDAKFVLLGDANNDPNRGEGLKPALNRLLNDPRMTDPFGDQITADWTDPVPGDMRVDYILPSVDWTVLKAGIDWADQASRHGLVWVEVE